MKHVPENHNMNLIYYTQTMLHCTLITNKTRCFSYNLRETGGFTPSSGLVDIPAIHDFIHTYYLLKNICNVLPYCYCYLTSKFNFNLIHLKCT